MSSHVHHFACHTVWTGAPQGPTSREMKYSRAFEVRMEGKPPLQQSASPAFFGDAATHNPEDLLVAALSTCHALSYLALAGRAGLAVEAYEDDASGTMEPANGLIKFTSVVLRPVVTLAPGSDAALGRELHEKAHRSCFIASSVNFPVTNEPKIVVRGA
ncbi:MAG TPA: OsmC family protein [Byssovorax sp.]|jgi:organic hydroperoxide reductase OsmC/OhrA